MLGIVMDMWAGNLFYGAILFGTLLGLHTLLRIWALHHLRHNPIGYSGIESQLQVNLRAAWTWGAVIRIQAIARGMVVRQELRRRQAALGSNTTPQWDREIQLPLFLRLSSSGAQMMKAADKPSVSFTNVEFSLESAAVPATAVEQDPRTNDAHFSQKISCGPNRESYSELLTGAGTISEEDRAENLFRSKVLEGVIKKDEECEDETRMATIIACVIMDCEYPGFEVTIILLIYQGITTACASVLGGHNGMPTTNIIAASVVLLLVPVGVLIYATLKLHETRNRAHYDSDKEAWVEKKWDPKGSWISRYGSLFTEFKSVHLAMGFGFAHIAKMLVVGILIGVLNRDDQADTQAFWMLLVQTIHFAAMLLMRPFLTMLNNFANLLLEASAFLPLAIAVFAGVDPMTCSLTARAENALIISAFLGAIGQFAMLSMDVVPCVQSLSRALTSNIRSIITVISAEISSDVGRQIPMKMKLAQTNK